MHPLLVGRRSLYAWVRSRARRKLRESKDKETFSLETRTTIMEATIQLLHRICPWYAQYGRSRVSILGWSNFLQAFYAFYTVERKRWFGGSVDIRQLKSKYF